MAEGKIRGITIELGADTTGLKKALKDVNSEVSTTSKELKDIEKLLKLDPGNIELLEQKQRLLNKQTENYETKLKALKDAQKEFADAAVNGDENAKRAFDALQREIISTEDYLQKAKTAASEFSAEAVKMQSQLNQFGNAAQNVADKTKLLSAAGAAVVGGLGAMAAKAMTAADDLNTLSAQTGFGTDELQKFAYAADRVDVSTETITGALKKLKGNMGSSASIFGELGISVKNADGSMRDATAVFYDSLEALSRVKNETERDTLAMQLFGKSADSLATIIDDGGAKLRALGDEAERSGKILSQESLDAANAVNDLVDGLKADVSATILVTGAKALEAATPVIEKAIEAVSWLLDKVGEMDAGTIAIIGTIALAVAAISPVAGLIAQVTFAISGLLTIMPTLIPIITAVSSVAPWIALGLAIGEAVIAIIENWDKIKDAGARLVGYMKTNIIDPIQAAWDAVKTYFSDLWENITGRAKNNINTMIGWVNEAINKLNGLTNWLNNSLVGQAMGLNIGEIGNISPLGSGSASSVMTAAGSRASAGSTTNNTTINNISQTADRPIDLRINLDGAVVAQQLYNANDWESSRRGTRAFAK